MENVKTLVDTVGSVDRIPITISLWGTSTLIHMLLLKLDIREVDFLSTFVLFDFHAY